MGNAAIEAFVTNVGKYAEGDLCGEWLKFPATESDVKSLLARIGVDGVLYEEYFISDYKTNLAGMQNLGEHTNIDELNYLASLVSDMPDYALEKFEAAAVYGDHNGNAKELINLADNLDCYELFPGVSDNDELGHYLIEEWGMAEIPDWIENYFDYEAYGRDFAINKNGEFIDHGFVHRNGDNFIEHYDGRNVPEEYRIFAYPDPPEKMPIKQQLEMYGKMVSASHTKDAQPRAHDER